MASELGVRIEEAARYVRAQARATPSVGIILGTGLGDFADALAVEAVIPYRDIPHFPVSTVESHAGELHVGLLAGRTVAVMKGRVHYYEGYSMQQVAFPGQSVLGMPAHAVGPDEQVRVPPDDAAENDDERRDVQRQSRPRVVKTGPLALQP